ncbi:MAG: hypothetical protein AAGA54_29725 [Myxococcota bacterium]
MRALLLAAWLAAPSSGSSSTLQLGPAQARTLEVVDDQGTRVATVTVRPEAPTELHLPPGRYTVRDADGTVLEDVTATDAQTTMVSLQDSGAAVLPAEAEPEAAPKAQPQPPRPQPPSTAAWKGEPRPAWRAPLMSTFVPGLGHAYAGRPLLGVGILAATAGATGGAVALWRRTPAADGASPQDASRGAGFGRVGGIAALSSVAAALYVGQIFGAYQLERGDVLRPKQDRVTLQVARLSSVSMAPGTPRATLYDDISISALARVRPRLRVGPSDLGVSLGPEQTVLQGGVRAMAELYGPSAKREDARLSVSAGGGVLFQGATRRRRVESLDPDAPAGTRSETVRNATPYLLLETAVFVTRRWSVGGQGRFGVPLAPRFYPRGRTLPRYAPTLELGVVLGVRL